MSAYFPILIFRVIERKFSSRNVHKDLTFIPILLILKKTPMLAGLSE